MEPMSSSSPPEPPAGPPGDRVVMVTFQPAGKLFPYRVDDPAPDLGTLLVVPTERGASLASVAVAAQPLNPAVHGADVPAITRIAGPEDVSQEDRNREREVRATRVCLELVAEHKLEMKLVRVQYLLGGQKAVFYFTAEGRVDFRALVRDLARDLRIRVEMRQIGVRDETKMIGGVGHCGLELCCSTWLRDFVPVSIRMAKDQNLALNPQKVSGACGRLLCCLAYEHETYVESRKDLPKIGRRVETRAGLGKVMAHEVLQRRFVVQLDDGNRVLVPIEDLISADVPEPTEGTEPSTAEPEDGAPNES